MSRKKMKKARPFENLLIALLDGQAHTKEELGELLGWNKERGCGERGPKIYNISSYIWDVKNIPLVNGRNLVIRSIRDGKKVTAYQLVSVLEAEEYLLDRGLIVRKGVPIDKFLEEINA